MSENGASNVNFGGGFNMAGMMAQVALGSAIGKNIAGTINDTLSFSNSAPATPPPIPTNAYHVVIGGKAAGPYDIAGISNLITAGTLTPTSLVWYAGLANWVETQTIPEINTLFSIPPIP